MDTQYDERILPMAEEKLRDRATFAPLGEEGCIPGDVSCLLDESVRLKEEERINNLLGKMPKL